MTAKDFPGFQDDPTPAQPPAPPATPAPAPPPLASYAFEEEAPPAEPPRKRNPLAGAATAGPIPTAAPAPAAAAHRVPPAPAPSLPEEDVRPGSAKDLWTCPHCGAGNKPQRTTCRSCGKSPSEPVAAPWYLRPLGLAAIALVVAAAVGLWFLTRVDLTPRPAEAAQVDRSVRTVSARAAEIAVEGRNFTPRQRISVVGRVLAQRSHPSVTGVTTVVLALGASAKEAAFAEMSVTFTGDRSDVSGGTAVILHLLRPVPVPERGGYLSLTGQAGTLADGLTIITTLEDGLVVLPAP